MSFLERRFQLAAHGTTGPTEVLAGVTTFLTMAYIVFVQPARTSVCTVVPCAASWKRRSRKLIRT